ncbi:MAG TPA: glycosyltransferase [Candidatus Angelobacter sp.]|nr:glycosyltransferase [Candidatus Angelobacter sp.]
MEHTFSLTLAMPGQVDISVIIATRNRAAMLERVLSEVQYQELHDLAVELIVVDNGSTDETQSVLSNESQLPLVSLYEETAGKSRALNKALDAARGELLVFTDDDVIPCPTWLLNYYSESLEYSTAVLFCGPIVPQFPEQTPQWLSTHPSSQILFGNFQPDLPEGPLPSTLMPYGANFAARRSAVGELRFDVQLGPSAENGRMCGEDSEFMARLRRKGGSPIFVPSCSVVHRVTPAQIEPAALFEKAFQMGKSTARILGKAVFLHEQYGYEFNSTDNDAKGHFERGLLINLYCGQKSELPLNCAGQSTSKLRGVLARLQVCEYTDLLSASARQIFEKLFEDSASPLPIT